MEHTSTSTTSRFRLFTGLAITTSLLTFGLIVFGAVVRVTDSGLGCGNQWPLCHGTIFPPLDNLTAWIEWLHRLFAMLIGVFGLATLYVAWQAYRKQNRLVLWSTVIAALLFASQSILGALVVIYDLPPTMVTAHLGTAMLLLGALLIATVGSVYRPTIRHQRDHVSLLAYITTALSLLIILTGTLVRGSGATLACTDWPLCNGDVLPVNQGQLALVHMTHRYAVVILGLAAALLVWYILRERQSQLVRGLAISAFVMYMMQAGVGAVYVLTKAASWTGAAHVGLAAATWALLVCLSIIETLNSQPLSIEQGNSDGIYSKTVA